MRLATAILGLLLGSNVLAAGFPEFPAPGDMRQIIVSEDMLVGGVRMQAIQFDAPMTLNQLKNYYNDAWDKQVAVTESDPWTILAHRIDDYLLTVQAQSTGDNRVVGFLGITDIFDKNAKPYRPTFKVPPGSEMIDDIEATDLGRKSRTVVFRNSSNIDFNVAFFRRSYKRQGFTEVINNDLIRDADKSALIMNGPGKQLDMTFKQDGGDTFVVAVLVEQ